MHEPEGGGGHRFEEAADPADDRNPFLDSTILRRYDHCVSSKLSEITQEALELPLPEQLKLARTLLERSEATGDSAVDAAWEDEIERRIHTIDAGLAQSRPFAEVVEEVDRQLGR